MVVYRRERRRRATLVLIVVTSFTLATLDQRGSSVIDTTREGVRDAIGPVQDLADGAIQPAVDLVDDIGRTGDLRDENQALRRKLTAARSRLAAARATEARIEELEELLDLPGVGGQDPVAARVVTGSVGDFERTFRIDRGRDDGIAVEMPVVVGRGLVGQVIAVSKTSATVRRLDDRRFAVGVRLSEAEGLGKTALAQGQSDSRFLRLVFLEAGGRPKQDQVVVTTGLPNEPYPPGLPVATVERPPSPGGNQAALLRPLVDLDQLDVVSVLRGRVQVAR